MAAAEPRLLFVVSQDFGELSMTLRFVAGQTFRARALVPERLLAANRDALPLPALRWASIDDVLERVAADDPDVVLLCSAYLYAFNGLAAVQDVARLLEALRGRPVVTTDPFLGLLARPDAGVFRADHPRAAWLVEHFGALARVLREVPHLYPVDAPTPGVPALSFFNPHAIVDRDEIARRTGEQLGWMEMRPPRARWVFILSAEDWARQTARLGRAFEDLVLAKLDETARARRQPVLIAPEAVLARLRARAALVEGMALVPFTSHRLFTTLVLDAEHVFYWNVLSNSLILRITCRRPVFFFDDGHIVHSIPALGARGRDVYWCGVSPPMLDADARLDADALAEMAAAQSRALDPTRERWRRSPSPDDVVRALLRARAPR